MKKTYKALRDISLKGKFWFSNTCRKLTDEEAKPYLEKESIIPYEPKPKKFVTLDGVQMSWGDYLKLRYQSRKGCQDDKKTKSPCNAT